MIVTQAKEAARQWVLNVGRHTPGFLGAFLHGSINWLPDDSMLPATSDVDVIVVLSGTKLPLSPGKFIHHGVLLDVSYLSANELQSPEAVLGNSHLAGSFQGASVILDPAGRLTVLQEAVSRDHAKPKWVMRRCEHAGDKILNFLDQIESSQPFHDQVVPWLFGTGVTTHVLLVAGLRNPTVRRRYAAVRDLLTEYGHLDVHEQLLALLGCADLSQTQVERHLETVTEAFDAAKSVISSQFFFKADISDVGRPIAIDGSRDLIELGFHREAVFWISATYARCQGVFATDAPTDLHARFTPGFRNLLADLGIASFTDLQSRSEQVKVYLPRLWSIAEEIIAAHPEIED